MIQINDNLAHIKNFELTAISDRNRYERVTIPSDLVQGKMYTISARVKQSSNGSGVITLRTYDEGVKIMIDEKHCKIDKDGKVFLTFVYDKDSTFWVLFYSDRAMETTGIGAFFDYIKLEEGDQMTPYLPYKTNVKAENQAIFPIGGGYHEIYPL